MGLTVVAVITRYLFNAPILGAQDLSELSLIVVVYPAMAYCGWTGGHVALDLLSSILKPPVLRWTDFMIRMACAVLFLGIAWQTVIRGLDALEYGEASNLIQVPHFPFFLIVAFGSAVFALVFLVEALYAARGLPYRESQ